MARTRVKMVMQNKMHKQNSSQHNGAHAENKTKRRRRARTISQEEEEAPNVDIQKTFELFQSHCRQTTSATSTDTTAATAKTARR